MCAGYNDEEEDVEGEEYDFSDPMVRERNLGQYDARVSRDVVVRELVPFFPGFDPVSLCAITV